MAVRKEIKLQKDQYTIGADGSVTIRSPELVALLKKQEQDSPWPKGPDDPNDPHSPAGPAIPPSPTPQPHDPVPPVIVITF
ncbi:hypothetical protein GO290_02733 [Ralstonia solanacearum]|nr:hypothetical protein [Ralstonia solanacearum]